MAGCGDAEAEGTSAPSCALRSQVWQKGACYEGCKQPRIWPLRTTSTPWCCDVGPRGKFCCCHVSSGEFDFGVEGDCRHPHPEEKWYFIGQT
jgi:hypothetical protein